MGDANSDENPVEAVCRFASKPERDEIDNGAYARVLDRRLIFYKMCGAYAERRRQAHMFNFFDDEDEHVVSSHASEVPQLRIQTADGGETLVGHYKGYTFFQKERFPAGGDGWLGHALAFLWYGASGNNVGPRGTSKFTEMRPLTIDYEFV